MGRMTSDQTFDFSPAKPGKIFFLSPCNRLSNTKNSSFDQNLDYNQNFDRATKSWSFTLW